VNKRPLRSFLARNPFPHPWTEGFFYREKMRAIHRVAPDAPFLRILEVGGGQSGLTTMLYPAARVVNIDLDPAVAASPLNHRPNVEFVVGDATALPFPHRSFDAVTMFDVIEHVPDHRLALAEARRVLVPGGALLLSTPNHDWRHPHHRAMTAIARPEEELFREWGHVRRGYAPGELDALVGLRAQRTATFINPVTVVCHDLAFSRLPGRVRRAACWAIAPVTLTGYALHRPASPGTETAYRWQEPRAT
jgi:SAM-dependent methyltransferase